MKERKSDSYFDPLKDMKSEWIDEAIDSGEVTKRRSSRINIKKILSVAACLAVLIVGTTCIINAEEISNAIRSLFQREQELIDPYAVVNTDDGQADIPQNDIDPMATSLKVDKVFIDGEYYYVYINIHDPAGFERTFLYYDEMGIYAEADGKTECISSSIGEDDPNRVAIMGANIQGEFVSDNDFEAVIKLDRKRDFMLPQGEYSFKIRGLSEAKPLDEPDEAAMKWYESKACADLVSDSFTVGEDGIAPLPTKTIELDTEFEIEGYKFVVDEITVSPMSVEFTVTDELHQIIEIDNMHFNAINLFCYFDFSKEYDPLLHCPLEDTLKEDFVPKRLTQEETEAFNKFKKEHGLFHGYYELGFELAEDAKKYWRGGRYTRELILGEDLDYNAISIKAHFSGPIYEDEILAIGFLKDSEEIPAYDERYGHYIDVEVWRNDAE